MNAFTLVEMLVVISILGLLAALTVPALKNLGKADATISASQQMLAAVGHARQLAMSQHTTVFMVFVPTNFWMVGGAFPNPWWTSLTPAQQATATNLVDKQLSGYTYLADGALGDQPGNHQWHYLAPWENLPDGTFIDPQKFAYPGTVISSSASPLYQQWNNDYPHSDGNKMFAFTNLAAIPFPTADATNLIYLPCIAFNYLGQLTFDGQTLSSRDEYIPVAQGIVGYGYDGATKRPQLSIVTPAAIVENPPGNSTNISYNIVHIDKLTGRAVMEFHKVQ